VPLIPQPIVARLSAPSVARDGLLLAAVEVEVDPLEFVRSGVDLFGSAYFFTSPEGTSVGGLGTAWKTSASGPDRFSRLRDAVGALDLPEPFRALVGFAFSADGPQSEAWAAFGSADAVVPRVSVVRSSGRTHLLLAVPAGSSVEAVLGPIRSLERLAEPPYPDLGDHALESSPPVANWRTAVAEAVSAIHNDAFRKVVLSRSVVVRSVAAPRGFDLLHHLQRSYRRCHSFAWSPGTATFLGASPELLIRLEKGAITSNPLAGSAPRGEGEEEDRAYAETLMRSEKDRIEHRYVVDDVVTRLSPFATHLDVARTPSLKRMATVQHLSTRIAGSAEPGTHVLDLVDAIHPTPAVGGTPRPEAVSFIEKVEGFDRGWYSGGVGWVDGSGDGEFALGLRCGLIDGTRAHVFAGAGIVADSDPELELLETRLKLRPMLELLAAT
jgi:salicylate biosynthesis isochorismate synthase